MENLKGYQTAAPFLQFSSDFQKYIKENGIKIYSEAREYEIVVATPNYLHTAETIKLNKQIFRNAYNK